MGGLTRRELGGLRPAMLEVEPDLRKQGIGRVLFEAIETWCREHGFTELASDARVDNPESLAAHTALGFEPTERLQFFRKTLA